MTNAAAAVLAEGSHSAISLAVIIFASTGLSGTAFGAFALVWGLHIVAIGVVRCVTADILILMPARSDARYNDALRLVIIAAIPVTLFALGLGILVHGNVGSALVGYATVSWVLMRADVLRFILLKNEQSNRLMLIAFAGVTATVVSGVAFEPGTPSRAWVPAGAGALAVLALGSTWKGRVWAGGRSSGSLVMSTRWLRGSGGQARTYLMDFLAQQGVQQLALWWLGMAVSLPAAGAVRGAETLFGPFTTLTYAGRTFVLARGADAPAAHRRQLVAYYALATGLVWALTLAALVVLGESFGTKLLGETWEGARSVLPEMAVLRLAIALAVPAIALHRWSKRHGLLIRMRIVAAVAYLGGTGLGLLLFDTASGIIAMVAVSQVAALAGWIHSQRSAEEP